MIKSKLETQLNSAVLAILGAALCVVPAQSFPASCVNLGTGSATFVFPGQYLFAVTSGYVGLNFPALHGGVFSNSNPNTGLPMDTFQQAQARYQVPGVEPVPGWVSPWSGRMSWVIQSTDGFYHASNSGIAHGGLGPALSTYTVAPGDFAPTFSTLAVNKAALVCYQAGSKSPVPLQMSANGDGPGPIVSGLNNGVAQSWNFNSGDNTYVTNSDPSFNFQLSGANN